MWRQGNGYVGELSYARPCFCFGTCGPYAFETLSDDNAEILIQMPQICGATLGLKKHTAIGPRDCGRLFTWAAWRFFVERQFWEGGPLRWGSRLSSWSPSTTHYTIWPFMFENNFCRGHHLSSNPARTVNEDFLGRIARLSRRVGLRLMDLCLIQCYFLKNCVPPIRTRHEQTNRPTRMGVKWHVKKWCNNEKWFQMFQWYLWTCFLFDMIFN